mmetsp:Transcript_8380/g.20802  ORF Transcript_8380/g.20802 Transcript_8380/m.20802 type:complete len:259 (+) Transcript_8380:125-901(+)
MYYIIPAGSLPPAAAAYEEPQRQPTAAPAPQYTLGVDAAGNHVLYLAPAADQAPPPLLAADGSILQSQLLSAQDAPLLFSAAPELEEPGSGPMAANIDAWGEPGFLSAPAAFPSEQRLGGSAAAPLSLAFESVPPHAKLQQQSLAPPPSATQDTAFLMQQLQQLQRRQQQQQQQQQRQQQQQQPREQHPVAQRQGPKRVSSCSSWCSPCSSPHLLLSQTWWARWVAGRRRARCWGPSPSWAHPPWTPLRLSNKRTLPW